jgi:hypothetical protein
MRVHRLYSTCALMFFTIILTPFVMIALTRTAEKRPSNAAWVSALGGNLIKWNRAIAKLQARNTAYCVAPRAILILRTFGAFKWVNLNVVSYSGDGRIDTSCHNHVENPTWFTSQ